MLRTAQVFSNYTHTLHSHATEQHGILYLAQGYLAFNSNSFQLVYDLLFLLSYSNAEVKFKELKSPNNKIKYQDNWEWIKSNWAISAQLKDVWWWSEHEFFIRVYLAVSHSAPLWARYVIQQPHRCYLLICGTGAVSTSARRTMNTHTEELLKWTSSPHFQDHIFYTRVSLHDYDQNKQNKLLIYWVLLKKHVSLRPPFL